MPVVRAPDWRRNARTTHRGGRPPWTARPARRTWPTWSRPPQPAMPTTRRSSTPRPEHTLYVGRVRRHGVGGVPAAHGRRATAGDRVVIRCASGPAVAVAVLGALRAGGVAVPVPPGDVAAVVAHCAPRVVVTDGPEPVPAAVTVVGPPELDARAEPVAAVGGGRGHRAPRLHLRRARRLPVAPRGAGQPRAGGGAASGPRHSGGPGAARPAALPLLRARRRSVPGLLGRGDRRPAGPRAPRPRGARRHRGAAPGQRARRRAVDLPRAARAGSAASCAPRWPACGCARAAGSRCRGRGRRPSRRRPGTASSRATG